MAAIGYTYSGGRLSQLDRKTYRSGAAQHQYYNFAYNVWGQTTATKVGSRTLSTNTYYNYVNDDTARGGNLKSTTYANGDSVRATPTDSLCDKALTSMKSYDVIYIIRMED